MTTRKDQQQVSSRFECVIRERCELHVVHDLPRNVLVSGAAGLQAVLPIGAALSTHGRALVPALKLLRTTFVTRCSDAWHATGQLALASVWALPCARVQAWHALRGAQLLATAVYTAVVACLLTGWANTHHRRASRISTARLGAAAGLVLVAHELADVAALLVCAATR